MDDSSSSSSLLYYVESHNVKVQMEVFITSLFGYIPRPDAFSREMYVEVQLYDGGRKVPVSAQTRYKSAPPNKPTSRREEIQRWNEWVPLPYTYSEMERDALMHFKLYDIGAGRRPKLIAHGQKYIWSKNGFAARDATPGDDADLIPDDKRRHLPSTLKDLQKMENKFKKCLIDKVTWLDKITVAKIAQTKENARLKDRSLYLSISMQELFTNEGKECEIVYYVPDYEDEIPYPRTPETFGRRYACGDPELGYPNIIEEMHHVLTRNARSSGMDRHLVPDHTDLDKLDNAIKEISTEKMPNDVADLFWKYRFFLRDKPKALPKFIRTVNWNEMAEVKQAIEVMQEWAPISVDDALELLGPTFTHPFVRRYAVSRLNKTPVNVLLLYLPQLIQSLRYETPAAMEAANELYHHQSALADRQAEGEDTPLLDNDTVLVPPYCPVNLDSAIDELIIKHLGTNEDMSSFLIKKACQHFEIANFLFWYLKVEAEANAIHDRKMSQYFSKVSERLMDRLNSGSVSAQDSRCSIIAQHSLVKVLVNISKRVQNEGGNRQRKLDVLKRWLSESPELSDLKGLRLPLDPTVKVKNVQPESTHLFSSKQMPMRITFSTVKGVSPPYECGEAYMAIFKRGDDLRQDQLVLQMIRVIDNIWRENKLDLRLTPYRVLATSISDGFVQFVKAVPMADIKNIQATLRQNRPSATGKYGIENEAMDNYVRSCAGYSVICYILGIGDRHMDNLLLADDGKMFHVDFGYILGKDPKPMPPLMKLTTDMINGMGGYQSDNYKKFLEYCETGFLYLRQNANLILSLITLMLDSGIPDFADEKDKVMERFHLDLPETEACGTLARVIETSYNARIAAWADMAHDFKQLLTK